MDMVETVSYAYADKGRLPSLTNWDLQTTQDTYDDANRKWKYQSLCSWVDGLTRPEGCHRR
jgi:hypothetical protein